MSIAIKILATAGLCVALASQDTPTTAIFQRLLEAFNSGDRDRLAAFLREHHPTALDRLDAMLETRKASGGFDLFRIESAGPTQLVAIVKEREGDEYARLEMDLEPDKPQMIRKMVIRVIPPPPGAPRPPRLSEPQALEALKAELHRRCASDQFSGAVLVAGRGKVLLAEACGAADRERGIPNRLTTRFRIGSMNKMFTAVAVAQLMQAGKVRASDPLGKYLPDYPNREVAEKVTIHHLLTHTGGTGDIFGPQFQAHRKELRELADYVRLYGNRPPAFEPGSRWAYSNYGYVLLGLVIEAVTKQSYYDYVREMIFKPAGMRATDSLPEDQAVPDRSTGYTRAPGGGWKSNADSLPYRGTSAGGGYSTVGDLMRFAEALLQHKLLDPAHTRLVTTGKVETPQGGKYAYGFADETEDGARWFGHGGGAPGMNGALRIFPDSGYVIAALANMDPPAAVRLVDFITRRLPLRR